jgi:hypothetical protein
MKPSSEPLVLRSPPHIGEPHPQAPEWRAVQVRLMDSADIEGRIVYAGPKNWQVVESFILHSAS